jgi:hypothetical protein
MGADQQEGPMRKLGQRTLLSSIVVVSIGASNASTAATFSRSEQLTFIEGRWAHEAHTCEEGYAEFKFADPAKTDLRYNSGPNGEPKNELRAQISFDKSGDLVIYFAKINFTSVIKFLTRNLLIDTDIVNGKKTISKQKRCP